MKKSVFLLLAVIAVVCSGSPLGKFKDQHMFLKKSEIMQIPKILKRAEDQGKQTTDDPFDCAHRCSLGMGEPICDCSGPNPPVVKSRSEPKIGAKEISSNGPDPNPENPDEGNNEDEEPDCAVMCKETSDGFPFCDCQHDVPIRIGAKKISSNDPGGVIEKTGNGTDPDPSSNCTNYCKETSDGFPFCDCEHDVPLRIGAKKISSNGRVTEKIQENIPKIRENNETTADCDTICKDSTDGWPLCDCGPNTRFVEIGAKKISSNGREIENLEIPQKKRRILPIQLFKNQKLPPFAHHYP